MAQIIESELSSHESAYVANRNSLAKGEYHDFDDSAALVEEPATLLSAIQTDLLYLRNPHATRRIETEDGSIQCHKLPSKLREVEWAKDLILHLYTRGQNRYSRARAGYRSLCPLY